MAAAKSNEAVVLNIGAMIDLAIGTPEVGVVDFGMLQIVLHCLAKQTNSVEKNVELRGDVDMLPLGRDYTRTVSVNEYAVDTEGKMTDERIPPDASKPDPSQPDSIFVVERVGKSFYGERTKKVTSSHAVQGLGGSKGESAAPEDTGSKERLSLVTYSKFNVLENIVDDLKERVYGSIPKNEDILEEVRSQTNLKAITDMWTSLNVSSRLEAAEAGITKLSSLIEDLISDSSALQDVMRGRGQSPARTDTDTYGKDEQTSSTSAEQKPIGSSPASTGKTGTDVDTFAATGAGTPAGTTAGTAAGTTAGTAAGTTTGTTAGTTAGSATVSAGISAGGSAVSFATASPAKGTQRELSEALQQLQADHEQLAREFVKAMADLRPEQPVNLAESMPPLRTGGAAEMSSTDIMNRILKLEKKVKECCESLNKHEGIVHDHINSFQDQLEHISRHGATAQDIAGKTLQDGANDLPGLMKLYQTVQDMKEELKLVHETALHLASEKEDRQERINAIIEQLEVLKTIKLDRDDMTEAMAEKADLRMLARKVSHDQFELACDDLSRGLDHALGKLNMQEALWQQALDDIQREIEMKLDKMELSPVKEFFNNKLKQLQDNLKQIASLRRSVEAAGAKKKLMRDLKCLSCDAKVVMPMEAESTIPLAKPLPPTLSMKPYLSYELDAIRKTQASNLPQRNLHDWEQIDKHAQPPKPSQKARPEGDKHICNRYCGGSHTVTTPAQRVARLGHFVKQWGPDVLPLSSGFATGDDGKMYKVSTEPQDVPPGGAMDTCTPKMLPKKCDLSKTLDKRVNTGSGECRCLEEGDRGAKN